MHPQTPAGTEQMGNTKHCVSSGQCLCRWEQERTQPSQKHHLAVCVLRESRWISYGWQLRALHRQPPGVRNQQALVLWSTPIKRSVWSPCGGPSRRTGVTNNTEQQASDMAEPTSRSDGTPWRQDTLLWAVKGKRGQLGGSRVSVMLCLLLRTLVTSGVSQSREIRFWYPALWL